MVCCWASRSQGVGSGWQHGVQPCRCMHRPARRQRHGGGGQHGPGQVGRSQSRVQRSVSRVCSGEPRMGGAQCPPSCRPRAASWRQLARSSWPGGVPSAAPASPRSEGITCGASPSSARALTARNADCAASCAWLQQNQNVLSLIGAAWAELAAGRLLQGWQCPSEAPARAGSAASTI